MAALEALAIVGAGIGAGAINTVVGSGTLITFPVLISLGYSPLVANVSNNIGLAPGSISAAIGYRRELEGQRSRMLHLGVYSIGGALAGAGLLLILPASGFDAVVPVLIALALLLVVAQPWLDKTLAHRRRHRDAERGPALGAAVGATGIYGGYFGASQGIILISILGLAIDDELQRLNGLKNVLAGLVNVTAGVVFAVVADVDWAVACLIAGGSILGAALGARYGRRLSPKALRLVIVVVGTVAIAHLML